MRSPTLKCSPVPPMLLQYRASSRRKLGHGAKPFVDLELH
eukprot:CAMPEP_0115136628 /NCGR_PEP_ID=MMETSP0227-20121206/56491_1 /TAXON_ID=89957 /ORGANISM="Polarella glacialis, Strain CCMP 1383" /LENGTH=39 /DNA_ID= /DNA_START= /DNA_END= /DNA_ORIENTATION=